MAKVWCLFALGVVGAAASAQTAIPYGNHTGQNSGMAVGGPVDPSNQSDPKAAIEEIKRESPGTREWTVEKSSEAYDEDHSNPALRMEKMWANEKGTVVQISGLARSRSLYSAVLDIQSLRLFNLNTKKYSKYITHMGGATSTGQNKNHPEAATKMVQLKQGESLHVFFEPIDDMDPHSLRYSNWAGGEDSYFDRIDPRFTERYDQLYAKASGKEAKIPDVKAFLLQFAHNDPRNMVKPVFVNLIRRLHSQDTFDGYYQSYLLIKDPADAAAAKAKAETAEQQEKIVAAMADEQRRQAARDEEIRQAKEARLAEKRRRDEARSAELRKQEEAHQAERRQELAVEDERRCMRTPACRSAWEEEQNRCREKIAECRGNCDGITGNGRQRSFFGGLLAAGLARGCYGACKCGAGIGELLARMNSVGGDRRASNGTDSAASAGRPSAAKALKTFECKIYCKSASGPVTYFKVDSASRGEAAKYMDEHADEICRKNGLAHASGLKFSESQCRER
ncbi:hypothetical protein [Massilia glaciei]|nr:hypothetical protein [Massilia glaciei]